MLVNAWYKRASWLRLLAPLEWLFRCIVTLRRKMYKDGGLKIYRPPVPVIVVGNLTVGGSGKTPLVIAMAEQLKQWGYKPGVVSRGYGGRAPGYPFVVTVASRAEHSGDEPLLIARRTHCPVVVAPKRTDAARKLVDEFGCDVIVSDDGLQHYALARDIEIVVVDASRGFGNERCLPAGPLREPLARLLDVDFVVSTRTEHSKAELPVPAFNMALLPDHFSRLNTGHGMPVRDFPREQTVHAVAGIGHPERFFTTLRDLGLSIEEHPFPDHHVFRAEDFLFEDSKPVVMTEKDAVKCQGLADDTMWSLAVSAELPPGFWQALATRLKTLQN